jgi:two-component system response regulator MprA
VTFGLGFGSRAFATYPLRGMGGSRRRFDLRSAVTEGTANGRRTILIVDDEPGFRELLQHRLAEEGWQVIQAATVAELFPILEETPPDVLVLDHSMPGITGLDAARILVRNGFEPPIVLFSAYLTQELKTTCRELGLHPVDKINGEELVVTCYELLEETEPVPTL